MAGVVGEKQGRATNKVSKIDTKEKVQNIEDC